MGVICLRVTFKTIDMEAEGPNCVCWLGCVVGMGLGGWDCVSRGFGGWGCVLGVGLVVGFVLPMWV